MEKLLPLIASVMTVFITVLVFALNQYQGWKSAQGSLEKGLQGDDASLQRIAYKVRYGRWLPVSCAPTPGKTLSMHYALEVFRRTSASY